MRSAIQFLLALIAAVLFSVSASAAGLHTHFLLTRKALPQVRTPALKKLLEQNQRALMCGVSFPDFGTALRMASPKKINPTFGSVAHHQAFVEAYFDHVMAKCGADLDACDQLVTHYLGVAAHGVMDDLYDEIFMVQAEARDENGGNHDVGADNIIIFKYDPVYLPPVYWLPTSDLVEVYQSMGSPATASELRGGSFWHQVAAGGERAVFLGSYPRRLRDMTYTRDHIITADGGVDFIAAVTADYWEVLWRRLHGQRPDAEMVLQTWPGEGAKEKVQATAGDPHCRVVAYFTTGMDAATMTTDTFFITGPAGRVPAEIKFKDKEGVVVLLPAQNLTPGATYTATLAAGIKDLRGNPVAREYSWSFIPE